MKSSLPATSAAPALDDEGTPVSVKIRERLVQSRKRFHANDNIAPFIEPGELEKLLDGAKQERAGQQEDRQRFEREVGDFQRDPDDWKRRHPPAPGRSGYKYDDDDDYKKRKKRFDIFDIFD